MDPNSTLTSVLRHIGTILAGVLIRKGWIDESLVEAVVGIVIAVGMLAYAFYTKHVAAQQKAATVAVALAMPADATEKALNLQLADTQLPPVDLSKA